MNVLKSSKPVYGKMSQIDHILKRPDMYVGSLHPHEYDEFISIPSDEFRFTKKTIIFSPALLRIFIEPLSNAIDNVARNKNSKCTKIKVNIDENTGMTTIWNDGEVIPIEINEEEKCYNHSMIFGQLLTSSNYDDDDKRLNISGRNGIGVKACNVFSSWFRVRATENGKQIEQEWTENMKISNPPTISNTKIKTNYTEVSWIPDFAKFGIKGYSNDIINLYCKFVVDAAMLTKVRVSFNDNIIPIKSLFDYALLYNTDNITEFLSITTNDCEVLVTPSNTGYTTIAFSNGVYNPLGGVHVDAWSEALFRPLVDKFNKKGKPSINIADIKKFFKIFIVASVINPEYDSQSKMRLENPKIIAEVKPAHITKMSKWSIADMIQEIILSKEMLILKKSEKKRSFKKIDGFDRANNEGGKRSVECTLILCEGLSAKTYAVKGITHGVLGKKGRDWFGIMPLRGKCLNVRDASPSVISNNIVISNIIQALGIRYDVDYTIDENYNQLSYGKVMIITDADCDGIHISALIQNFFHSLFPSLFDRKIPFIVSMQTPIVRIFLPRTQLIFYDERKYLEYVKNNKDKKINKKYYKGLGSTSNNAEIADTFGKRIIEFVKDEHTDANMIKLFHKNNANTRKEWLTSYDPNVGGIDWKIDIDIQTIQMNMSDFINHELIKFSIDDCSRSIPSLMDGNKESHRKVLYAVFLKNLKYSGKELKTAQLAGYVAEKSGYHHGEQNLNDTITRMANNYVGSNNIPLLYRGGQFGTRLSGGKDAANARYTYTKMDVLTRLIYRVEDDDLLLRNEDDGDIVEPKFYVPIIPMVLVNGCTCGIGTGWSSNIPCYNPLDLVQSIKKWLKIEQNEIFSVNLVPWYHGFKGMIEAVDEKSFSCQGIIDTKKNTKVITELPIGMWTDKFRDTLDDLLEKKKIKGYKDNSTAELVNFVVTENDEEIDYKLSTIIKTSNMVLFDENQHIKKYNAISEIINNFCDVRYEYYVKRKKNIVASKKYLIKILENKKRFLDEILSGDLMLFDKKSYRPMAIIIKDLESRKYEKIDGNYDYLLHIQFGSISAERVDELSKEIENEFSQLNYILSKTEAEIWIDELDEFVAMYNKWLKDE